MLLIDWWFFWALTIGAKVVATSIFCLRRASKISIPPLRFAIKLVCASVGAIASLLILFFIAGSGCVSHSIPIYSPSGRMAARIEDADEGATGGESSVELFWAHGFREQTVYEGEWKSVRPSDMQWTSDTDLAIHYSTEYNPDRHCYSVAVTKVGCLPR